VRHIQKTTTTTTTCQCAKNPGLVTTAESACKNCRIIKHAGRFIRRHGRVSTLHFFGCSRGGYIIAEENNSVILCFFANNNCNNNNIFATARLPCKDTTSIVLCRWRHAQRRDGDCQGQTSRVLLMDAPPCAGKKMGCCASNDRMVYVNDSNDTTISYSHEGHIVVKY
jgi:hypothetical protein